MDASSALAPHNVDTRTSLTEQHLRQQVDDRFAYNPQEQENPPGSNQPRKSCGVRCWGRCKSDDMIEKYNIATHNCWITLRQWKQGRKQFPLKVRLSCPNRADEYILTDYVGSGETILLLHLLPVGDLHVLDISSNGLPMCTTSQCAFHKLLEAKADDEDILDFVTLEHSRIQATRSGQKFALQRDTEVLNSAQISLTHKSKAKKAKADSDETVLPFGLSRLFMTGTADDGCESDDGILSTGETESNNECEVDEVNSSLAHVQDAKLRAEEVDNVPSTARMGLCGYDIAPSSRATCVLCLDVGLSANAAKIQQGSVRFFFRPKRNVPDRSLHAACVHSGAILSYSKGSPTHWQDSADWLQQAILMNESDPDISPSVKELCVDALHVFRKHLSGASASSAG